MGRSQVAKTERDGRGARRRRETREKLLRAAHALMARKGPDAVTIQEITEAADVGFGSFYNHFESKEAIVRAIVEQTLDTFGAALDRIAERVSDPAEVFAASVRYCVRRAGDDESWGWFLVRMGLSADALRTGLGRRMARDIGIGIEAGRFRVEDREAILLASAGAILSIMAARLRGEIGEDVPERAATVVLSLLGLSPEEARSVAARPLPDIPVPT